MTVATREREEGGREEGFAKKVKDALAREHVYVDTPDSSEFHRIVAETMKKIGVPITNEVKFFEGVYREAQCPSPSFTVFLVHCMAVSDSHLPSRRAMAFRQASKGLLTSCTSILRCQPYLCSLASCCSNAQLLTFDKFRAIIQTSTLSSGMETQSRPPGRLLSR